MSQDVRLDYWNSFYAGKNLSFLALPSQFATFALGEILTGDWGGDRIDGVIEFGCGNGRDSHFFSSYGLEVLAIDASVEAIEICQARNQYVNASFLSRRATESGPDIEAFLVGKKKIAVYARFFMHAINDEDQQEFLRILGRNLPEGCPLFFEYRTLADAEQEKIFGDHYRRYLDHEKTLLSIEDAGFSVIYEVEGRGLAKYKDEDAKVGRCLAVKR